MISKNDRDIAEILKDNANHPEFVEYYAEKSKQRSVVEDVRERARVIISLVRSCGEPSGVSVLDVGCGPGVAALTWASLGYRVAGVDISEAFIELAKDGARQKHLTVDLRVGSADALPWPERTFDVCLAPELLEHVKKWELCLDELSRVTKPGGALFLSTTNRLCPRQQEFNLPLYSWYPKKIKRRVEKLAATSWPQVANYATFPAVNWFTASELVDALMERGFDRFFDRFDLALAKDCSGSRGWILRSIAARPELRWLASVATPGLSLLAIKRA